MIVKIFGETIVCDQATRTATSVAIIGEDRNGTVLSGIRDLSRYELVEGEWTVLPSVPTTEERLAAVEAVQLEQIFGGAI